MKNNLSAVGCLFLLCLCTGGFWVYQGVEAAEKNLMADYQAFLANTPAIDEVTFERKLLLKLDDLPPPPPGGTGGRLAGSCFVLRFQTNAYFLRQMDVLGEVPERHLPGHILEGAVDDKFWKLSSNQLNLWPSRNAVNHDGYLAGRKLYDSILGLGLDHRIIRSSIRWKGDSFTAEGEGGLRFEGKVKTKTAEGLPKKVMTWLVGDAGQQDGKRFQFGVDYEYRQDVHAWLPAVIKPFLELNGGESRTQEFHIRTIKLGDAGGNHDRFLPTLFTNQSTKVILHTNSKVFAVSQTGTKEVTMGAAPDLRPKPVEGMRWMLPVLMLLSGVVLAGLVYFGKKHVKKEGYQ